MGINAKQHNFIYLLIALLIVLIGLPIAFDVEMISLTITRAIGFSALLAIGVLSFRGSGQLYRVAMAFVIAGIALNILFAWRGHYVYYASGTIAMLAFLLLATFGAFRQIATEQDLTTNRLVGAIDVYLLLGVVWSLCYALLEFSKPGSFKGLTEGTIQGWNPEWLYYSFVTLTTLGYGDISPVNGTARALAYLEAIAGVFYLAILVAGMVGTYIAERTTKEH